MPIIKKNKDEHIRRSNIVWAILCFIIVILAIGTFKVQIYPDERIVKQAQKQYWINVDITQTRGEITDKNGWSLAISEPVTSFFVDPKFWNVASADKLKSLFGSAIAEKFSHQMTGRFCWVERNVPLSRASKILKEEIPGLYRITEKRRVYPHKSLAFHVLGYCDIDELGQAGIELAWNHVLYSPPHTRFIARESNKHAIDIIGGGEHQNSKDTSGSIKLTLDAEIQQVIEKRLAEGAKLADASWAACVCVNPSTGEIIALASYPTLDANNRKDLINKEVMRNNVLGRVFEPGSIFKPITMSIALETGAINPNTTYRCGGTMKLFDKTMSDVNKHAHGLQDLTHVLMNSCNIGMSLMSMGVPKYHGYGMLKQYGFGSKTEVEIAGEETGLMKQPEEWLGTVPANIFIGQGIAVTPIQLVMAISAIANGGALLKPYIVDEVKDSTGKIIHKGRRRVKYHIISQQTSDFIRQAMGYVVSEGGGKLAKSNKVQIGGKTGTAQVASSGQYVEGHYVASFIGFWPLDKPKYAMVVNIGEPKGQNYYGGQIAAPIFKNIVEDIIQIGR